MEKEEKNFPSKLQIDGSKDCGNQKIALSSSCNETSRKASSSENVSCCQIKIPMQKIHETHDEDFKIVRGTD